MAIREGSSGLAREETPLSRAHALLYGAIQRVRREPVAAFLRDLDASQWWPESRLRVDQLHRLQRVLDAASHAPHYRRGFAEAGVVPASLGSLVDLARFPILEKAHLRSDPDALRNPRYGGPIDVQITTGSSGVPLRVYRSRVAGACGRAAQIRGRLWFGIRRGDREVVFGGHALERLGRARSRWIDRLMNRVRLGAFDLSDQALERHLVTVRRERPAILYGYPSALAVFAAHVERRGGGRDLGVRLVQTSSERLYDHRRAVLRTAFGCPVVDEYGAAETSILAMECPAGGLHQATENALIEIVDASGRPVPPGTEGEVVVTDLNNLAAPIVRYRIGDRALRKTGVCACGRGLPLMEVVEGSAFGLVTLPDGRRLSGVLFYFLAESLISRKDAGLREIVIVRRRDAFTARAVPRPGGDPAHREELARRLGEIFGSPIAVEIVDRIERHGSDKYRILIDES